MSGLSILRYLSGASGAIGVTRIAKDLSLNPSTCFNLLKTLVHEGLVNFDESSKTYTIGLGLIELAKGALDRGSSVRMVRPYLQEIADEFRVTATLWQCIPGERVMLVDLVESASTIRVHMSIGQRLPMYIAALGRCIAAASALSRNQLEKKFNALRWEKKPSFEEYAKSVDQVTSKGFAVDEGNYVRGVTTVSAAVLDELSHPVMAISAVGFSAQLTQPSLDKLGSFIKTRADIISSSIGAR